jgi:2-oxoglutarate ferredoxin oxidoreductase subunit alpha
MSNTKTVEDRKNVVILFAGDSGDGIQLTGTQFTDTNALFGNDVSTFPNFPAEIRAPQGTLAGVSGYQLQFGSVDVHTPGDQCDCLVVMNAAALKSNIAKLRKGGILIANLDGFDKKNLTLAGHIDGEDPLNSPALNAFTVHKIEVTKMTREALKDCPLSPKEKDRCKNMFVLGFIDWMYSRKLDKTIDFLGAKFGKKPEVLDANIKALKAGYHFGDTSETFTTRFQVAPAKLKPGTYRSITGNKGTALGLVAAGQKAGLEVFYGSYPITPASDILHELSRHKNFGVKTFQAEDEIAAICSAIGASYGGAMGVTASSGPGIALKGEALGLAFILELPLVVVNVQRGGPSTGLPTKTEQSDLFQALYGRNGEAPIPVIAASTPADCFETAFEAARIAVEHMTPVMYLSDGYIANGSEPWQFPESADIPAIRPPMAEPRPELNELEGVKYLPYVRDEKGVRKWALPGMEGLQHRIGGLEKQDETGDVSYDPQNHEKMVHLRAAKVKHIADTLPELKRDSGPESGELLVITWGSTYGTVRTAVKQINEDGERVAHLHLRYLMPFQKELESLLKRYKQVLVPEMNMGQLAAVLRAEFLIDIQSFTKVQGLPFTAAEVRTKLLELLNG